jgi:hypothetical protein
MSKSSLLFALVALACITGSTASQSTLTSVTQRGNAVGTATPLVVTFSTVGAVVVTTGTITLNHPAGYFTGTATCVSGQTSVSGSTLTTVDASSSLTTAIKLTLAGTQFSATSTVTVTLSGLTLAASNAGSFTLETSGDTTPSAAVTAPAVVAGITGVTLTTTTGAGSSAWPVLVFTPVTELAIGNFITITMPAGYFIGTAAFAAGKASPATTMTGSAAAVTATSTQIVITTAGAVSGTSALTITLSGLTLGSAMSASFFTVSTSQKTATFAIAAPAIVAGPTFTSISWIGNAASYATDVVLVFTPGANVAASGTINLAVPQGYFTGTGTFAAGKCSVSGMTGTTTSAATSGTTSIAITISNAGTGTTAVTMTLTGLSLGTAQAAGYISLSTSAEPGTVAKAVPAIGSVITSASITLGSDITGTDPKPVLVFTPVTLIPTGGTITITMPAGYFIGTAAFAAGKASPATTMTGSATAVTATSTEIVITTAGAVSGTSALTVTLSGLTLGSVRAVGSATSFALSTSENTGMVFSTAPAILGGLVTPSVVLSSYLKGATGVTATVTFTTATAGSIKTVTVAGVNFGSTITSALTCTGLTVGVASIASTTNLVLTVTQPASIAANTVITCNFAGLTNSATAAAASTVSITTATVDPTNIDRATGVFFPAIFNALLVTPSIVLSSNVKAATAVSATVTFTTATVGSISKITVAGVNFDTSVTPTSAYTCTGISAGTAALSTTNLVLTVTTPASISAATVVTCTVAGLKNAAATAAASMVSIATDTGSANLDGAYVSFPAIVDASASPSTSKSSASFYEFSALLIALLFLFA